MAAPDSDWAALRDGYVQRLELALAAVSERHDLTHGSAVEKIDSELLRRRAELRDRYGARDQRP